MNICLHRLIEMIKRVEKQFSKHLDSTTKRSLPVVSTQVVAFCGGETHENLEGWRFVEKLLELAEWIHQA